MPLSLVDDTPKTFPKPSFLTSENWKRGVVTLIDPSRLPKDALAQADNIFLVEDGQPSPRPGVDWYGAALPAGTDILGFDYFDANGSVHIVVVSNDGKCYRSTNNGTSWTEVTGATFDTSATVSMNQYNNFLYLTNGVDDIARYDGSTILQTYATLATPAAPTKAETGSGLSGTNYSYTYKVARVSDIGYSVASVASAVVESGLNRVDWSPGTNYVTLTTPASVSGQTRWDIYISDDLSNYYYLGSVASGATVGSTATWIDDGTAIPNPVTTAPDTNSSQGPAVEELTNVGSRMYGVRDTNNRYRIWFTSGQAPFGTFTNGFDGGYIDWQQGGKLIPKKVVDYRNGQGTPLATVFCDSADGQGGIIQIQLETLTIADVSITVPSAYLLPGSRGTPAPGSVVNVLNDFMFYNSQAFYNLGSRAQFLNLLSTDETSANIRPSIKQISQSGESGISSIYFDAKVYFSVPYGASTNNNTAIYDTERKAWLPKAFTLGFKKFLRYTDTSGGRHLLCIKPGDTRLSEISSAINGDYTEPFTTILKTGLIPTSKNRYEFQWTEEGEIEFSNPEGEITIDLIGIERARGLLSVSSKQLEVTATTDNTGWDTFLWDSTPWDDTSTVPEVSSEPSIKRYFTVQRELNAVQWQITTTDVGVHYVLRSLQTWGTETQAGKPRSWRI